MEDDLSGTEIFYLMAIGIAVMLAFALAFILFTNRTQRKLLNERMRQKELQLRHKEDLLYSTIQVQEEERRRIAQDLHDDIGTKLNVIFLNLHRLRKIEGIATKGEETIDEINRLIGITIDTTRRISHNLLPPTLEEFGLVEAVKELVENFEQSGVIKIDFDVYENQMPIRDKVAELNIYRVLQELIKNSLKHGEANLVNIRMSLSQERVRLEYQDNGKGFDMEKLKTSKKGLGMKSIESRMEMINAKFEVQSSIGEGIVVNIDWNRKRVSEEIS
jgi:signal transduction histidine kinase